MSGPGCLSLCPYPAACHFVQGVQCLTSHKTICTLHVYKISLCVSAFFCLEPIFLCVCVGQRVTSDDYILASLCISVHIKSKCACVYFFFAIRKIVCTREKEPRLDVNEDH